MRFLNIHTGLNAIKAYFIVSGRYCLWKTIMKYLESEIFTNIMSLKWEIAPKCKDRLSFDSGKV